MGLRLRYCRVGEGFRVRLENTVGLGRLCDDGQKVDEGETGEELRLQMGNSVGKSY